MVAQTVEKMALGYTHQEAPWRDARADCEPLQHSRDIIDKSEIRECFSQVAEKYVVNTVEKEKRIKGLIFSIVAIIAVELPIIYYI